MRSKKICDRCGCEIDEFTDSFGVFEYPKVLVSASVIESITLSLSGGWEDVDLCKKCRFDFWCWVKKGKEQTDAIN